MAEQKKQAPKPKSPPGSLMSDITKGLGAIFSRKKREADAQKVSPDSGNPCHYQTHVGDRQGMNRQGRVKSSTCHHGK